MRIIPLVFLAFFQCATAFGQPPYGYRLLQLDARPLKWGEQNFGAGATITFALVSEERSYADARNCREMAPVDPILSRAHITKDAFEAQLAEAFSMWEAAANVTFKPAADPQSADILIGVDVQDRGSAHADVLPDPGPGLIGGIARGLVCLSATQDWKIGFGGDPGAQDLRYTLAHEIGHAIGLNHPGPHGQLMSFNYSEDFSSLQQGDISGAAALYGPAAAPNAAVAGLASAPAP